MLFHTRLSPESQLAIVLKKHNRIPLIFMGVSSIILRENKIHILAFLATLRGPWD
ncbi:unnamed protein product [Nesidiocoris tenuis]|uniref:Uncharacterized protein n=1 Tax=Nesidiocoris tenuis TaxID=355587 RepID=A0A6H5G6X4_9HEMI|nr:unnamed protein product [Nesidiocoris tenuis]